MSSHLLAPPAATFWLDELRLAEIEDARSLFDDPGALDAAVYAEFAGPAPRRALGLLRGDDAGPLSQAHALLIAWFLRMKKSAAVIDVAEAALPAEALAPWRSAGGRKARDGTASSRRGSAEGRFPRRAGRLRPCRRSGAGGWRPSARR